MSAGPGSAQGRPASPLTPSEERATFRLADPGLTIELVASEPDVVSPVAVAWDEDGRMFVAEMIDYPSGPESGRVRMLEDSDGDGKFERVTIFADHLPYPTSVLPWNGGVLVTAAPNIWFLKDTTGDGVADERRVVLTGFGEGNQQLRVNGLTWGSDNWVYAANGRSAGEIRRPDDPPAKAVSIRRNDLRFRPATGEVEAVAGMSQFGLPRDDRGDRFPSWNTVPLRHVVIEEPILSRNSYLAESSSVASILDPTDNGAVFAISPTQARFNRESAATFNASCGPTIYRGDLLGAAYLGNAFVCESLTNLVHRRTLEPAGPTFVARRVEQGREFLASTDSSFRPVNLATGPDGALYVVDFYREMVEHPQFVPEATRKSVEFRRWADRGRIWRILRKTDLSKPETSRPPRLSQAGTDELVRLLGHPNGWWRDTSQRFLVERRAADSVPVLSDALRGSKEPLARLHALWTLDGLEALDRDRLSQALGDPEPIVREAAVRLAAGRSDLTRELVKLADDPEIRVRFRTAIALGDNPDVLAINALARIATRDTDDEWVRLAILSGLRETAWPFLQALLRGHPDWLAAPTPAQGRLLARTTAILGARHNPEEMQGLLEQFQPGPPGEGDRGRIALLAGLIDGLARSGEDPRQLLSRPHIEALLDRARRDVESADSPTEGRIQALEVLARCRPDAASELVPALLRPEQPEAVQAASARALAEIGSTALASRVLGRWGELATGARHEVLTALLGSAALTSCLLDAIEAGTIGASELDATNRERLKQIRNASVRSRAERLLADSAPPDRREVLRAYQAALTLPGDVRRGEELFAKNCLTCHQRQGKGQRVGPDLSGVAGRPAPALLNDILDPNQEVSPDFINFLLATKEGRIFSGLLVEETATSLKLRLSGGAEESVLRSEVEEFRSTGRSLMPEGLEQSLTPQGLADLLAFLGGR